VNKLNILFNILLYCVLMPTAVRKYFSVIFVLYIYYTLTVGFCYCYSQHLVLKCRVGDVVYRIILYNCLAAYVSSS